RPGACDGILPSSTLYPNGRVTRRVAAGGAALVRPLALVAHAEEVLKHQTLIYLFSGEFDDKTNRLHWAGRDGLADGRELSGSRISFTYFRPAARRSYGTETARRAGRHICC